jgi:fructose-bisphosphate aldolase class II
LLINMKELLFVANQHGFAVGAFNVMGSNLFKCVIEQAEEDDVPLIVESAPPEIQFVTDEFYEYVKKRLIDSPLPCVLHLDHGKNLADCMKAIRLGFTSVMVDGSVLLYEENVALTSKVVEVAHPVDVSVEGEIGTIGSLSNSDEGGVENVNYTNPCDVIDFVSKTNVDSLAIAIGTAHGIYPKGMVPTLRLDLLKEIKKITSVPLVLHGGSGNSDEEIEQACKIGINKVNISSDYKKAFYNGVSDVLRVNDTFSPLKVYAKAIKDAKSVIHHKLELFGCIGKAELYR